MAGYCGRHLVPDIAGRYSVDNRGWLCSRQRIGKVENTFLTVVPMALER